MRLFGRDQKIEESHRQAREAKDDLCLLRRAISLFHRQTEPELNPNPTLLRTCEASEPSPPWTMGQCLEGHPAFP
jgi:hypothetical protein